jgi:peptidoglycan/xylan/chitin deacetylase (PgdA/CDA1 family)
MGPMIKLAACLVLLSLCADVTSAQQMAITFDDLPAHGLLPPELSRLDVANSILATLSAQQMPPTYGFINGAKADGRATLAVLQAWRSAGQPLGNHTWMHRDFNDLTVTQFETEITKNEPMLGQFMSGQDWHWFRYPFLREGQTARKTQTVRAWLAKHGYQVAQVTMDFEDYLWNPAYERCAAKHDDAAIAKLHDSYLNTASQYLALSRELSHMIYGRDINYVLLLHIGAFDAKMLPELLALYRSAGFTFVSLQEAQQDPAYRDDEGFASQFGGGLLEQMMRRRHLKFPPNTKPYKQLDDACRES